MDKDKGNSFSNGPSGNSGPGTAIAQVRHDEFCPCIYCLQGHR